MSEHAMIFAPAPLLTVTVEQRAGRPDIHLHAGGQGVWQARMLTALGGRAVLVGGFGGESGAVLRRLLRKEGIQVCPVRGTVRNGVHIQDRRGGRRVTLVEAQAEPPSRHDLDELHNLALVQGIDAQVSVLSGPSPGDPELAPPDVYRRLAADLTANGARVVADLTGSRLAAVAEGGAYLLKVSHEELGAEHLAPTGSVRELAAVMRRLRTTSRQVVVVSRAEQPALALAGGELYEIVTGRMTPADPHGSGDSMTAGIVAGLLRDGDLKAALRLGAAAGAINATRHGLGTGGREAVERLAALVDVRAIDADLGHRVRLDREELAAWLTRD
ncbi:PfkB family carbohydrate kinase [Kitasatospora sp. CMC57]|uniref:PfkB family carbohydrate kinase n=1 Tax=Kitasatospora sp. CMC57 TaxID=3231513 RepID=A0AB33K842_9ACTN